MVDPDSDRVSRAPPYSGTAPRSGIAFRVRGCHALRQNSPVPSATHPLAFSAGHPRAALQHRCMRFGLFRFRSPLLTESLLISFPGLLRWFTSSGLAPPTYFIQLRGDGISSAGLPHSVIRGSLDVCSFPRLFAACRDLLRPAAP